MNHLVVSQTTWPSHSMPLDRDFKDGKKFLLTIVLALYNLQCYHFNEFQRGFSGKQVKKFETFTFNLSACRLRQL